MSAYEEREKTALLVIDVQNDVVDNTWRRDEKVTRIADLVSRARDSEVDVIWVQHSESGMPIGSQDWQIVPELKPAKNEKIIHKIFRSAFEETELEEVLEGLDIGHLVIMGAQTNYCVRHTIHAGFERGFNITLVEDAHTTMDETWDGVTITAEQIVAELNRECSKYQLPDSFVDVAKAESIHF